MLDYNLSFEERFKHTHYKEEDLKIFYSSLEQAKQKKQKSINTIVQAWRIGRFGFVSIPGEMFSEIGIKIKQKSPFEWTFPVSYGGDYRGYLMPQHAWEAGGYESLIGAVQQPNYKGVEMLTNVALNALEEIYSG